MKAPLFIVGVPRSGTTLLSVLLNNHSLVYIDKDAIGMTLLKTIRRFKNQYAYHPGQDKGALLKRLIDESYKNRLSELLDQNNLDQFQTLQAFLAHSIQQKLTMENKQLWGDKTPELSAYLPEIKALFPTARVIHIVRNPFANCKSLKERQYLHIKLAAQQWKDTNAQGLLEQYIYGPQQYHLLRYEDLLRYPENTVRELCTFLNIPFEEGMLRLAKATSTQKSNAYVSASFNTQKLEDWKRALSLSEKRSIQDITGDLMTAFDYAPIPDLPINMVRSLSYGQRIRLRTWNILRLLFKKERVTMSGHTLTPISLTVSKRVRTAVGQWIRLFFSAYIYQVFLETIRKEYKKPEPDK